MPVLVLEILKYAFLAILYIFVVRVVRAVYLELKPQTARREPAAPPAAPSPARAQARKAKRVPKKAVVVEGDALKGKSFQLGSELIIGRGEKCHVKLDDPYVSQAHARIFAKGDSYVVEDLGSTNGTYLNRSRLSSPVELQRGDRVKIGKTVLEMRK
jgi:pSer/pThr/pTyr-binding forkhead associated (FHA) protein